MSRGYVPPAWKQRKGLAFSGRVQTHGKTTRVFKHGKATRKLRTPTWQTWWSVIQRCTYPSSKLWKDYGAKGIKVCYRWRASFNAFSADMGTRPQRSILVRLDTKRGYFPGNCAWRRQRKIAT